MTAAVAITFPHSQSGKQSGNDHTGQLSKKGERDAKSEPSPLSLATVLPERKMAAPLQSRTLQTNLLKQLYFRLDHNAQISTGTVWGLGSGLAERV